MAGRAVTGAPGQPERGANVVEDPWLLAAEFLARLREEFAWCGLAFVADPRGGVWIAVGPREFLARAGTGMDLRARLIEAGWQPSRA